MLTHIHIENFTVIESLSLDFASGFNVLTGETGAGKSIWVDAVELVLGGRADSNMIYAGKERCDITLCFDIRNNSAARAWLQTHEIAHDECLIRRTLYLNNPSRSTINGTPCTQQMVRELSETLVAIHGQHENYALLKPTIQQEKLDSFAGNQSLLNDIEAIYKDWQIQAKKLEHLKAQAEKRDAELTLYRYQLQEIQALALKENEFETLFKQHQSLHHAKDNLEKITAALELLTESDGVSALALVEQAHGYVAAASQKEVQLNAAKELLNTATIHLQEASVELNRYCDAFDLSPEHMESIATRLNAMHDLARKHQIKPEALGEVEQQLVEKIAQLENIEQEIAAINKLQQDYLQKYKQLADKLTLTRNKAAKKLNALITQQMNLLGMEGGEFRVVLESHQEPMTAYGNERIRFEVITNPGQPFQPMHKIVSGGELSRISLALQAANTDKEKTPAIIFDEVDVGIGGKTAEIVGRLLKDLGEQIQVLCITHLPQIAALGHHHFKASKNKQQQKTQFQIQQLTAKDRIAEIARMLGGNQITPKTLAHAEELLA